MNEELSDELLWAEMDKRDFEVSISHSTELTGRSGEYSQNAPLEKRTTSSVGRLALSRDVSYPPGERPELWIG